MSRNMGVQEAPEVPGYAFLRAARRGRISAGGILYARCPDCGAMVHAGSDDICECGGLELRAGPDGEIRASGDQSAVVFLYGGEFRYRDGRRIERRSGKIVV